MWPTMSQLRKNRYIRRCIRRLGTARVIIGLRLLELPLRYAVRLVVSRISRERALLVFGAPLDRFTDNTAYLFLRLSGSPELRCVWITGSPKLVERLRAAGHEAELRMSIRGLRACLRAQWYVVSSYAADVNRWTHDGARLLNLWHGIPLKTIERDIPTGPMSFMFAARSSRSLLAHAFLDDTRAPDAVLSTSPFISERCFATAFGVPRERCLDFGYPRTDHFFGNHDRPFSDLLTQRPATWKRVRSADFVVGYFPTWRDDDSPFIEQSGLSIERLAEVVDAQGGLLVFKPHGNTALSVSARKAVVLDPDDDLNLYLPLCSALITDYSSVAFDFMLLDRPILYYVPDLQQYRRDRGLYFEPADMMPGPMLFTAAELYAAVAALGPSTPADERVKEVRALVWNGYEGRAAQDLRRFLETNVSNAAALHR